MKSYLKTSLLIITLLSFVHGLQKTAVLSLEDGSNEEISLLLDTGIFKLNIFNAHFATDPVTVFCLRERPVEQGKNNKCTLIGLLNNYDCW